MKRALNLFPFHPHLAHAELVVYRLRRTPPLNQLRNMPRLRFFGVVLGAWLRYAKTAFKGPPDSFSKTWKKDSVFAICFSATTQRWKWTRLTTSWHLKKGFTLNVVHHADKLSVVYQKRNGKKRIIPQRTFQNVRFTTCVQDVRPYRRSELSSWLNHPFEKHESNWIISPRAKNIYQTTT